VKDYAFTLCPLLSPTDYRLLTSGFFDLGLRFANEKANLSFASLPPGRVPGLSCRFLLFTPESAIPNSKFPLYAQFPMRIGLAKGDQMG
jgi:hypothetical protein